MRQGAARAGETRNAAPAVSTVVTAATIVSGTAKRTVRARESTSLVVNPEILVLDEPTSAVDAHTEARIAARLRDFRAGRTTVVMTTSPLLLEQCDEVALLVGGTVVAQGTHRTLMRTDPNYRAVVIRGEALVTP